MVGGEVDAYVHSGGFYEWDTAAPVAVARAAGFHASRIDGSALTFNQSDLLMPDILVCRPAVAGVLLASDTGSYACALITSCPSLTCSRPRPSR